MLHNEKHVEMKIAMEGPKQVETDAIHRIKNKAGLGSAPR